MSEQDKQAYVIERAHAMAGWGPYNDDAESRMKAAIRVVLEDQEQWVRRIVGARPGSSLGELTRQYADFISVDLAPDQSVTEPLQSEAE